MVKERKNICYAYRIWKRNAHLGTLVTCDFHSEKDTKSKDISDEVFLELLTLPHYHSSITSLTTQNSTQSSVTIKVRTANVQESPKWYQLPLCILDDKIG